MSLNFKKLLFYSILVLLIPVSVMAIDISIEELRNLVITENISENVTENENIGQITYDSWNTKLGTYLEPAFSSGRGLLLKGTNKYINFSTSYGSSGYGIRDDSGTMKYKNYGGSWTEFSIASSYPDYLGQIGDVSTTSLATNDILFYNGTNWVRTATTSWDTTALSQLGSIGDVSTTTLAQGYTLAYDGTDWTSTSSLFVDSNGYVGIGETTPTAQLHLKTSTNNKGVYINASSTEEALWVYSNVDAQALDPLVFLEADNAGFDQSVLTVQQDGTGNGIFVDQNGDNDGIFIDSEATTAGKYGLAMEVTQGGQLARMTSGADFIVTVRKADAGTDASFQIKRDADSDTTAKPVMMIEQDNAGDDQNALTVQNDGTGDNVFLDTNGEAISLNIDTEATNTRAIVARGQLTGNSNFIDIGNEGEHVTADKALLKVYQNHAGTTAQTAWFLQAGTGNTAFFDTNGNAISLNIDSEATSATVLNVTAENTSGNIVNIDDKFVLDYAGNVGIGTTTPARLFSIGANGDGFGVDTDGIVQDGTWQADEIADTYLVDTLTASNYLLLSASTSIENFTNNLGLGTTTPQYDLDIQGTGSTTPAINIFTGLLRFGDSDMCIGQYDATTTPNLFIKDCDDF